MDKTKNDEVERRYVELEMRAAGDEKSPVIEGDGAVFGVETVVERWFREKIRAGAFTRVLSEKPDVIGAFNHDWTYVLGRTTSGTLMLEQTDKGLRYHIDVNPNDPQAMSVYEKVKRGDVTQSSFAFTVRKEEWTEPGDDSEQLALREIVEKAEKLADKGRAGNLIAHYEMDGSVPCAPTDRLTIKDWQKLAKYVAGSVHDLCDLIPAAFDPSKKR